MQRILKKYYEQLYANKVANLYDMDKILEVYDLPQLNQNS